MKRKTNKKLKRKTIKWLHTQYSIDEREKEIVINEKLLFCCVTVFTKVFIYDDAVFCVCVFDFYLTA